MRVILQEDDVKLGNKGDVVEVANGYARNYLIPQGLVVAATSGALKHNTFTRKSQQKKLEREQHKMQEIADKISETEIVIKTEVGENEKLFGSITNTQIVTAIKEALDIEIDKKRIGLHQPLRTVGEFTIPIKVYTGVDATLKVIIADKKGKKATLRKPAVAKPKSQDAETQNHS